MGDKEDTTKMVAINQAKMLAMMASKEVGKYM